MSVQTQERDFVDLEQHAIAEADREFTDEHGNPDDWSEAETDEYVALIATVHGVFHPGTANWIPLQPKPKAPKPGGAR